MKKKYITWINKNYPDKNSATNKCNVAVCAMVNRFWELKVQVGYVNGIYHCWTIDDNKNIVDPTAHQFNKPIKYKMIADRFLQKDEFEPATGAIFSIHNTKLNETT